MRDVESCGRAAILRSSWFITVRVITLIFSPKAYIFVSL